MKVNVEYDKYNTKMIKAEIPTDEDSAFLIELEDTEILDENGEATGNESKLVLISKDTVSGSENRLSMNRLEAREFAVLLNNFRNSME